MDSTFQAALFDLDGTLIESEGLWVEAYRSFLFDRGMNISKKEAMDLIYGKSFHHVYEKTIERYPLLIDMKMDEMGNILRENFASLGRYRSIVISSSLALLNKLADRMKIAIVSGSRRRDIEAAMDIMGIRDEIEIYLGAEDYSPGKPHPACYRLACRRLSLPPEYCIVFEDSEAGVQAAKSAGIFCVALKRPGQLPEQDLSLADKVVADLSLIDTVRIY